jgi:hypothetical protein
VGFTALWTAKGRAGPGQRQLIPSALIGSHLGRDVSAGLPTCDYDEWQARGPPRRERAQPLFRRQAYLSATGA